MDNIKEYEAKKWINKKEGLKSLCFIGSFKIDIPNTITSKIITGIKIILNN